MLGDMTKKYESGNLGPRAISNDPRDPGGASYGTYQLSTKTGTLQDFLQKMGYEKVFIGRDPGTDKFGWMWLTMCDDDPDFSNDQWAYIKMTHYDPVRTHATSLGILDTPAIDEMLWSMGVQHGRANHILEMATEYDDWNPQDETIVINDCYDARCDYVDSLKLSYLKVRYRSERQDILKMVTTEK